MKLDLIIDWDDVSNLNDIAPMDILTTNFFIKKSRCMKQDNKFKVYLKMNFKYIFFSFSFFNIFNVQQREITIQSFPDSRTQ